MLLISLRITGSLPLEKRKGLLTALRTEFGAQTHYDALHSSVTPTDTAVRCVVHDDSPDRLLPVTRTILGFIDGPLDRMSVGLATDPHGRHHIAI